MLFSDQVSILSTWFKNWNECEQTVALFSLLKRVKKRQAKFLARCLEHGLKDCVELIPVEQQANDAGFIGKLMDEPKQELVINILLSHLPLLRPGNDDAKSRYLNLLPRVLAFAVERSEYLQESRQLLSYSLIHPAFDNDERSSLTSWMEHLDENVVPDNNYPPGGNLEDPQDVNDVNHNKLWKDDPALPKPESKPGLSSPPPPWQGGDSGYSHDPLSNSKSPSTVREDLDPVSRHADGVAKSTSEDGGNHHEYDFNPWLKSLRLHKYKDLFASMTYDEMMQLTEEKLEKKNVTKGARDKILLNIKRLHERFERLQALEKEIPRGGSLKSALNDLKNMIYTPIKRFEPPPAEAPTNSEQNPGQATPDKPQNAAPGPAQASNANEIQPGDIPGQFTKVMGKACTQLLISKPDKDNITTYMQLLEKCIQHAAFTAQQKKRLLSWKSQVNKMYRSLPRNQQLPSQRNALGSNYPNRRVTNRSLPSIGARMTSPIASPPLRTSNPLFAGPKMWTYGSGYGGSNTQPGPHTTQPPIDATRKTVSLDTRFVQRFYPPPQQVEGGRESVPVPGDTDIRYQLDSLCHSVAEHALAATDFQEQN